jgi:tetratricopeptide (TPR) repeat protein
MVSWWIAERHKTLTVRLAVLSAQPTSDTTALIEQARAAIEVGDYDDADRLLNEAEEAELTAARRAQAKAEQRQTRAAEVRAERGALALTRLDYQGAAAHFETAANWTIQPAQRADCRARQAGALFQQGDMLGDNAASQAAIAICKDLLKTYLRERVPLDWAMTQSNLGNVLRTLGEREPNSAAKYPPASGNASQSPLPSSRIPASWC